MRTCSKAKENRRKLINFTRASEIEEISLKRWNFHFVGFRLHFNGKISSKIFKIETRFLFKKFVAFEESAADFALENVGERKTISLSLLFRIGCLEQFKDLISFKEFSNLITYIQTDKHRHTCITHFYSYLHEFPRDMKTDSFLSPKIHATFYRYKEFSIQDFLWNSQKIRKKKI